MEKEVSLVLSRASRSYRRVAQLAWGLTDEQMKGMHVHHHPPVSEGGRNIPEHLYVCSPSMHAYGWHKGEQFPKMGSEGGRLSAIVRRKKAEETKKLPKEEQVRLRDERRRKREVSKKQKEIKQEKRVKTNLLVKAALEKCDSKKFVPLSLEELENLQEEMVKMGFLHPDPAGLQLW